MHVSERLARARALLASVRDIVETRVESAEVPAWAERRGWAPLLLALDEATLRRCEAGGLAELLPELPGAPSSLLELGAAVTHVTELPRLRLGTRLERDALRQVRQRKREQLSCLLAAVEPMARAASRIVDVGAGSGHFTRLSAELFERDALGLEHNPERVAAAQRRAGNGRARFEAVDARSALALDASDLAIGLHCCGELGDHLVTAAAQSGCDLALVSCCLQKISAPSRAPLSRLAAGSALGRQHLGLTNLTAQPQGVEADIETTLAARRTRYALGRLLRARGVALEPGAEMSGINRRQANHGLAVVAERALTLRGLPPASAAELAEHDAAASRDYALIRRLSLPRSMLARLVEVLVSLDRAQHLQEAGAHVLVASLFDRGISPRNIGIFASQRTERLPAA